MTPTTTTTTTDPIRDRLEWSWNWAVAEAFADDTICHNAQWVAMGIPRGCDQTDDDLLCDWVNEERAGDPQWDDATMAGLDAWAANAVGAERWQAIREGAQ